MRRFWVDRDGNVAIIFALAIIPIVGAMGAAVDYSMASAYRTDVQKALDATALALSKLMPTDQGTLDTVGNQYFQANLGYHSLQNLSLTVTPGTGTLKLSATGTYPVRLANIIGADKIDLGASAEVKWSIGKVEIALVLDNSGSMGSYSRMTYLKEAAHNLLDVLENAAKNPDDAKVAIVPFDQIAGVGPGYVNESWLDWTEWEAANGTCSKSSYKSLASCTSNGGVWTPANHSAWEGCVRDRNKNQDVSDAAPDGTTDKKYPAWQCGNSINSQKLVALQPLTANWSTLHSKIDAMAVAGYTNIPIGLVWGWHVLSPTALFTEGVAYGTANLTKYIILMTDGDNTRNRWYPTDSTSVMNTRTSTVCANIKATGIKIYTIRLVQGNASLLQGCASDPSMYYDVQESSDLVGVFSAIGAEIANLHLSK
jgi:Flp pilus assembly protein TadG